MPASPTFADFIETVPDAIIVADAQGRVRFVNAAAEALFGWSRDELLSNPLEMLLPEESRHDHGARREAFFEEPARREMAASSRLEARRKDGTRFPAEIALNPVTLDGEVCAVAAVRDVTAHCALEVRLAANDRLSSMGLLAAGIIHEISNPLTAVLANLDIARETLTAQGAGRLAAGELDDAADAARRIRDLIADLRVFSRSDTGPAGLVDVHSALETSLRLARHELRPRATVVTALSPVPPVLGSEGRLVQVFLNLLMNAAQAIPADQPELHRVTVSTSIAAGGRVLISVRDTGEGMPPHVLARLFTPFFTTKPAGVGTGLGLAICRRIVCDFGGEIEASSAPGEGTEFRVLLAAAPRRAHVLLVDDERELTSAVRRALHRSHDVEVATSGADALARLERGERFDVIFCDLAMPEMSGIEVHRAVGMISPAQAGRIVFVTGGAALTPFSTFLSTVENARVDKPFQIDQLERLIGHHSSR